MAVLFLVGERKEEPEIVSQLLNISIFQSRPNYLMASDAPLVLHECKPMLLIALLPLETYHPMILINVGGFENAKFLFQPRVLEALSDHFEALEERCDSQTI